MLARPPGTDPLFSAAGWGVHRQPLEPGVGALLISQLLFRVLTIHLK